MRLGPHPVGTALWLKAQEEMRSGGRPIRPISVIAEVGDLSKIPGVSDGEHSCLVADWQDVENWALVILTLTDGSRGVLLASDIALGGMMDTLEVKLSNAHLKCNISHSNLVQVYAPDESVFQDAYIQEKLETKAGWSHRSIEEEWMLGYPQEIRHFVECVIYDREPLADAHLGRQVVEVIYAAYQSAEEGRRITLARP